MIYMKLSDAVRCECPICEHVMYVDLFVDRSSVEVKRVECPKCETVKCVLCGSPTVLAGNNRSRRKLYCSKACRQKAWLDREREKLIAITGLIPQRGRPRKLRTNSGHSP